MLNNLYLKSKFKFCKKVQSDYTKYIELDPKDAITYFNRGKAYYNLELLTKSIHQFFEADDTATDGKESLMDIKSFFITGTKSSELVEPT